MQACTTFSLFKLVNRNWVKESDIEWINCFKAFLGKNMDKAWFTNVPVSIFIDNSAYRSMHFSLSSPVFSTLRKAVADGDIEIIVTEISRGEFVKHAEEVLREDEAKLRKCGAVRAFYQTEIESLTSKAKELTGNIAWEKYSTDFKVKSIDSDVKWQSVFQDYFSCKPPFTLQKKSEFPDAFNIKMLDSYAAPKLVIISSDGDYKAWIGQRQNISLFSSLNEFTDCYLKIKDEVSKQASQAFNAIKAEVIEKLSDTYSDSSFYTVTCFHSEIELANVIDLHFVSTDLVAMNHEKKSAVFNVRLRGKATLDLSCPVVAWDSIDKEEIHLGSNSKSADIELEIQAVITVFINEADPTDSDFEITDDEIFAEDFEVPDSWTSFLDNAGEE
jgi:PIN domain